MLRKRNSEGGLLSLSKQVRGLWYVGVEGFQLQRRRVAVSHRRAAADRGTNGEPVETSVISIEGFGSSVRG